MPNTTDSLQPARSEGWFLPLVMMSTGAASAIMPLAVLSMGVRVLPLGSQGTLAVALTFGTFAGQLLGAAFIEAPLAQIHAKHTVRLPHLVTVIGLVAALAAPLSLAFNNTTYALLISLASAVAVSSRLSAIANNLTAREAAGASALGICVVGGFIAAGLRYPTLGLWLTSLGVFALILARLQLGATRGRARNLSTASWVVADTTATGLSMPLISLLVLGSLGPAATVTFRLANTVASATDPAISFLRMRLLRTDSRASVRLTFGLVFVLFVLVTIAAATPLFPLLFGPAWATLGPRLVGLALLSRVSFLLTTPTFARLRRGGYVRVVFFLRLVTTFLYLGAALATSSLGSVELIFLGFIVAEIVNSVIFRLVAKKVAGSKAAPSTTSFY